MEVLRGCRTKTPKHVHHKWRLPDAKNIHKSEIWSQCGKKKAYETRRYAERLAEKIYKERGVRLRVYACPHCKRYHLSKKTDSIERKSFFRA